MARAARSLVFGTPTLGATGDLGLMLFRVFAGLALALSHGLGKLPPAEGFVGMVEGFGLPMPQVLAWLSALAETAGGILLALGLLTRPAALFIVINMSVALIFAHAGDPFGDRELPLMFGVAALMFLLAGPGRYSVDAVIGGGAGGGRS